VKCILGNVFRPAEAGPLSVPAGARRSRPVAVHRLLHPRAERLERIDTAVVLPMTQNNANLVERPVMKRTKSGGLAAVLAIAVFAGPTAAQQYWWDLGVNAGGSLFTSMIGADEGFSDGNAKFSTSWLVGSQLTIWPWSRVGLRANGQFADRGAGGDNETISHVNLWGASGDLMLRFRAPRHCHTSRSA